MNVKDLHLYPPEVQAEVRASAARIAAGDYREFHLFDSERTPWQRTRIYRAYWFVREEVKRFFRMKYRAWRKP